MSKYTVTITSAPEAQTVSFVVTGKTVDYYKGRKTGTRTVKVGEGTVKVGEGKGHYAHRQSAGWSFRIEGDVTADSIRTALTDNRQDFYLR